MGLFDRLTDFGDRELVRTYAYKISIGVDQISHETSDDIIKSLSHKLRQEVEGMLNIASKLTAESISCLDVKVNGVKMPYTSFLAQLKNASDLIVQRGGYRIL